MPTPPSRVRLAEGYDCCRIINGGWQLAAGHGPAVDRGQALSELARLVDAGWTTFDVADIYEGVEELLGELLRQSADRERIQVHTKFVPDLAALPSLARRHVEAIVDRSLLRLGVERLDLVQLHWWDYGIPGHVEAAEWLDELRQAGKIRLIGATNFDVRRLSEIVDAGVPIASHQVQISLLDRRVDHGMTRFCLDRGIGLVAYGTLAGGFLSGKALGSSEPTSPLPNRSLTKYRLIIDEFGGWSRFQQLLTALDTIADKHGVSAATIAGRWVLDRPGVAGIILGTRDARRLDERARMIDLRLDDDDRAAIAAILDRANGPAGDVYDLERERGGRHAAIMRYDLNRMDPESD